MRVRVDTLHSVHCVMCTLKVEGNKLRMSQLLPGRHNQKLTRTCSTRRIRSSAAARMTRLMHVTHQTSLVTCQVA
jgi:hypothetical protein